MRADPVIPFSAHYLKHSIITTRQLRPALLHTQQQHFTSLSPASLCLQTQILNANKKALLPLLRLHLTPPHNRIRTRQPNPLHRRRTPQTQHLLRPLSPLKHPPLRLERIPNSKKHRTAQKQRRLAYAATALNRAEILPFDVFEE